MSNACLKPQVLGCYRLLNRTCQKVFAGDFEVIQASRIRIKEAFVANAHLTDPDEIKAQIKVGEETADYIKKTIVQAELVPETNTYKLRMTDDTHLEDSPKLKPEHTIDLNTYTVPEKYKPNTT